MRSLIAAVLCVLALFFDVLAWVCARRNGGRWTSGASGFTLKDCVGTYERADESSRSRSTFEFWLDGERLRGKETVADPEGRHVRVASHGAPLYCLSNLRSCSSKTSAWCPPRSRFSKG